MEAVQLLARTSDIALRRRRDGEQSTLERRALLRAERRASQCPERVSKLVRDVCGIGARDVAVISHEPSVVGSRAAPACRNICDMHKPAVVTITTVITAALALGCLALAVGHSGVTVPLISRLGPGGGQAVVPAAVAFAVATVLLAVLTIGAWRQQPWAWAAGLAVHGMVFAGAAFPYRGVGSLVGMLLAGSAFVLLASRPGREAMLQAS